MLARTKRVAAVAALGFLLMFVSHFLTLTSWIATEHRAVRPPYWWSYLVVYPIAGLVLARRGVLSGWNVAFCLCAAPVLYFLLLGIMDGTWLANSFALGGSLGATLVTGIIASRVRRNPPRTT
jgi:hypothetical protein